jgi:DNA-binding transcriptional LysR family regulator
VIAGFRAAWPGVDLEVTVENALAVEARLLERTLDLAVVEWATSSSAIDCRPLRRDSLVLVAPRGHRLVGRERVTLDDLRGERFVMREPGSGTRALTERALGHMLAEVETVLELTEPEAIIRIVQAGTGLAFLPEVIVWPHVALGALERIEVVGIDLWRDFSLATLRQHSPTPAARAFTEHLIRAWTT